MRDRGRRPAFHPGWKAESKCVLHLTMRYLLPVPALPTRLSVCWSYMIIVRRRSSPVDAGSVKRASLTRRRKNHSSCYRAGVCGPNGQKGDGDRVDHPPRLVPNSRATSSSGLDRHGPSVDLVGTGGHHRFSRSFEPGVLLSEKGGLSGFFGEKGGGFGSRIAGDTIARAARQRRPSPEVNGKARESVLGHAAVNGFTCRPWLWCGWPGRWQARQAPAKKERHGPKGALGGGKRISWSCRIKLRDKKQSTASIETSFVIHALYTILRSACPHRKHRRLVSEDHGGLAHRLPPQSSAL